MSMTGKKPIFAVTALCAFFVTAGPAFAQGRTIDLQGADAPREKNKEKDKERSELTAILARFDEAQKATKTLTASFTEKKEIHILKEPVLAKGRFFYTRPDDVLLEYTEPEVRYLLFTKEEQLYYYPKQKKAERGTSARVHDYILRFLAIGQTSDNLKKFYEVSLDSSNTEVKDAYLLVLKPRKRMIKKAVKDVLFWIGKDRLLPVKMQWREPDGDSTTITFDEVKMNPEIQANVYHIEIPKDVQIIKRRVPGASEFKDNSEG